MISSGTRIYGIRDLEETETANKGIAGEPGRETDAGWKDLNERVSREEDVTPEREAELQAQYDEEAEIKEENERQQQTDELLTEGQRIQGIRDIWKLEKGEPEGRVSSKLEPFEK